MSLLNRSTIRQFVAFTWGSATGLLIDLAGFQLLLWLGAAPVLANLASSTASITAVYFLVVRYSFDSAARVRTYLAFAAWYCSVIVTFSVAIQLASSASGWNPLIWKLASVPASFTLNYLFSRLLFSANRTPGWRRREP